MRMAQVILQKWQLAHRLPLVRALEYGVVVHIRQASQQSLPGLQGIRTTNTPPGLVEGQIAPNRPPRGPHRRVGRSPGDSGRLNPCRFSARDSKP